VNAATVKPTSDVVQLFLQTG